MKRYAVHSCFPTIQGEGFHAGTPAVFIRFSGCNFWNGKQAARGESECPFCDTDFVGTSGDGGGRYTAAALAQFARSIAPSVDLVVCTGGEPLLQLDESLVDALHAAKFIVAVETNGSINLDEYRLGIDWVCCSPKAAHRQELLEVDELKVVYPAEDPLLWSSVILATHQFIQPMDGDGDVRARSTERAVRFVMAHPDWRLSVQTHKDVGIP